MARFSRAQGRMDGKGKAVAVPGWMQSSLGPAGGPGQAGTGGLHSPGLGCRGA